MTEKKLVLCSHCAARLNLPADSTRTNFKCVKCGKVTPTDLGISLAQNSTAPGSGQSGGSKAALVSCPVCGKKVSSRAPTCPGCGEPIFRESKVVVYGYTQQFLINPKVQMFWNGAPVGALKKGDSLSFGIKKDGEVSFSSSTRKSSVWVKAGRVTKIKISWDRHTGKMIPQIVDVVTPGA